MCKYIFISYALYFAISIIIIICSINDIEKLERKFLVYYSDSVLFIFFICIGGFLCYIPYWVYLKQKVKRINELELYIENHFPQIVYRYYKLKKYYKKRYVFSKEELKKTYRMHNNNASFLGYVTNINIAIIINILKEKIKNGRNYRLQFENK